MRKLISAVSMASLLIGSAANAFTYGTATFDDPVATGVVTDATKTTAQGICAALAAAHGPNTWRGTLDPNSFDDGAYIDGSVALSGTATKVGPATGVGTPVPESVQVSGEPYRVGGSVNMFGLAAVVAAHYPNSEYDISQGATWNSEYGFTCDMEEYIPQDLGHHEWQQDNEHTDGGKEQCEDGNANPHPYDDRGKQCLFVVDIPQGWYDRDSEDGTVTQYGESGTLDGHESMGGPIPVDDSAQLPPPVQVVVCISPNVNSKKTDPATGWAKKNGYTGSNCNTTYYKTAPVGPQNNLNTGSNNNVTIPFWSIS